MEMQTPCATHSLKVQLPLQAGRALGPCGLHLLSTRHVGVTSNDRLETPRSCLWGQSFRNFPLGYALLKSCISKELLKVGSRVG